MKTTTHTSGEWNWACDSYGKVQHSRKYDCVYTVVPGNGGDRIVSVASRIEHNADARLIAAAPEILDALVLALPYVQGSGDEELYKNGAVAKIVKQIRAAINKAEGKS